MFNFLNVHDTVLSFQNRIIFDIRGILLGGLFDGVGHEFVVSNIVNAHHIPKESNFS